MPGKEKKDKPKRVGIKEQMKAAKNKGKESSAEPKASPLVNRISKLEARVSELEKENQRILSIFANAFNQLTNSGASISTISTSSGASKPPTSTQNHVAEEDSKEEPEPEPEPEPEQKEPEPPKKATKKLNWMFQSDHKLISQGDNGQSATKPKFKSGTIRFGKFIPKYKDGDKYTTYSVTFDTNSTGSSSTLGFGFGDSKFSTPVGSNWGDNGSAYIKGNGQFITSNGFVDLDGIGLEQKQTPEAFKSDGLFNEGDDITMEINVKDCIGIIRNDANPAKVVKLGLPKNKDMGFILYMGGSAMKKIKVKDQQCSG